MLYNMNYTAPKLAKGKIEWFVYFRYLCPVESKWKQYRDRAGLNSKALTTKQRNEVAKGKIEVLTINLKNGWLPGGVENSEKQFDLLQIEPAVKVFANFIELKKASIKRRTWQSYKYSADTFEKWLNKTGSARLNIRFITNKHTTAFFDSLMQSGVKNKTINNHARNLGVLFNMAIERGLLEKNPLKNRPLLPEETGKNFAFSDAQKEALKKEMQASDPNLWRFVKCIYHLFIRPSELLELRIQDIDFRTKQITVHSSVGKNKRQMAVTIPDSFFDEIKSWGLEKHTGGWYVFGSHGIRDGKRNTKVLQPAADKMHRNTVTMRHSEILQRLGFDSRYTMYGWKHTGNVDSFLAGVDIHDLMRQNRHHSINQTYTYLRSLGLRPNVGYSSKAPAL